MKACLKQLLELAKQVLALTEPRELASNRYRRPSGLSRISRSAITCCPLSRSAKPVDGGAGRPWPEPSAGGLGPVGLAAAAAAAVPSIISLFSSTTTVKDHTEDITDLTTTTSVLAAVAHRFGGYTLVDEDFRLAPEESQIREGLRTASGHAGQADHQAAGDAGVQGRSRPVAGRCREYR